MWNTKVDSAVIITWLVVYGGRQYWNYHSGRHVAIYAYSMIVWKMIWCMGTIDCCVAA